MLVLESNKLDWLMVELGSRLNTLFQVSCALRVWPAKTRMPMTRICSWTLHDPEHAPGEELPKIPLLLGFKDSHYRRKCLAVSLYCPLISISKVINGRQKNEGHLATEKFVGEDWKRTKERLKTIKPIISKFFVWEVYFYVSNPQAHNQKKQTISSYPQFYSFQ